MAWNDGLNEKQLLAVGSTTANVAVVAGPGTGKTKTLLRKACQLIEEEQARAEDIRIANFTVAGTIDLRKQIVERPEYTSIDARSVSTFHALALRCLMAASSSSIPKPLVVLDDWGEKTFVDQFAKDKLKLKTIVKARKRREDYNSRWCMAAEDVDDWLSQQDRQEYEQQYNVAKDLLGFTTRGELTFLWWRFLKSNPGASHTELGFPWKYLLVDEYQDLNECEHEILEMLSKVGVQVFAVGDPNQSIYGKMRHAHPEFCWSFAERLQPGEIFVLDRSYRCPKRVLRLAQAIFAKPEGVPNPELSEIEGEAEIVRFATDTAEVQGLAKLARTLLTKNPDARVLLAVPDRRLAKDFVVELAKYVTVEDRTSKPEDGPDECRLAQALLEIIRDSENGVAVATAFIIRCAASARSQCVVDLLDAAEKEGSRVARYYSEDLKLPPRLEKAREWVRAAIEQISGSDKPLQSLAELTGCESLAETVEEATSQIAEQLYEEKQLSPGTVTIMTLHSSKGMEADFVLLPAVEPGTVERDSVGAEKEERRRLLFVGMTRPIHALYMSFAANRSGPLMYSNPIGQSGKSGPSIFIQEVCDRSKYEIRGSGEFLKSIGV